MKEKRVFCLCWVAVCFLSFELCLYSMHDGIQGRPEEGVCGLLEQSNTEKIPRDRRRRTKKER